MSNNIFLIKLFKYKTNSIFFVINLVLLLIFTNYTYSQTEEEQNNDIEYTENIFWTTRLVNLHTIENLKPGKLDFRISHRMGKISSGSTELFGLYQASSQFGLDYGVSDNFMLGISSSTINKLFSGYGKYRILRQCTGKKNIPLSVSVIAGITTNSQTIDNQEKTKYFSSKLFYYYQIIVARKFSEKLSLQIIPSLVHRNLVVSSNDKNDVFSVGFSGRYKITKKIAATCEYSYIFPEQIKSNINGYKVRNSFSLGCDIFTGRHTFQLFVTNSVGMDEKTAITETTEKFNLKNIRFGFNISRIFTVKDF